MPETCQSDNGKEVKGSVKRFCQMKKIRMVQSRSYNPSAQGKVKWSHCAMKNKISFGMVAKTQSGTN